MAFSPDGKMVATGSHDNTISIWATETRLIQNELSIPGTPIYFINLSPDGSKVAMGISDGTARVWDVNTGQETTRYTIGGSVWNVNYAADGQVFFAANNVTSMFTWDVLTGITRSQMTIPQSNILYADIAPDGETVVAINYMNQSFMFDAVSGELLQ